MSEETKYSIEKVHEQKSRGRRVGNTVDAIMEVIGLVMVTENENIALVVNYASNFSHMRQVFVDVLINHFHEEPTKDERFVWSIKGYSSKVHIFSEEQWYNNKEYGWKLQPVFDIYYNRPSNMYNDNLYSKIHPIQKPLL